MRKNNIARFIIALIIIGALLALFVFAYHHVHHRKPPEKIITTHPVVAIDIADDKIVNQNELLSGKDALLAIRNPTQGNQIFSSLAALQHADSNKDGRIDKKDLLFSHLELVFFTEHGTKHKYVPLPQAGITAIILTPESVLKAEEISKKNNNVVGKVLMSDGKELDVRIIPVTIN